METKEEKKTKTICVLIECDEHAVHASGYLDAWGAMGSFLGTHKAVTDVRLIAYDYHVERAAEALHVQLTRFLEGKNYGPVHKER